MRLVRSNELAQQCDNVRVTEEKRTGLNNPKCSFVALDVYESTYGPADPAKIKMQKINGQNVHGVDVVKRKHVGVYDYIN